VKPVGAAVAYLPTAARQVPYGGADEMLLVDEVDNKDCLVGLFETMHVDLPVPQPKRTAR
jgi:hypothetical protein